MSGNGSVTGVTITPDTNDWTWVLQRPCPECGFDAQSFPRDGVGDMLRRNVAIWRDVLGTRSDVRERPRPTAWSPLEYGCHVRDVYRFFGYRLDLMLTLDRPDFANWDQDATALAGRYHEQDPALVAHELSDAGAALATAFDSVRGEQWRRTGHRSDGSVFTVDSFGRYLLHDVVHHVWDVRVAA
jgi:hypothetical protein